MKYIAIPKSILLGDSLYASTKRYAAAQLSFRRDERNCLRKPLRYLAERANLCVSTARQAIIQLEEIGFLSQERTYRYDAEQDTVIYDATIYTLNVDLSCGYVLISYKALRKLLSSELTHAAFVVALLLLCVRGLALTTHGRPCVKRPRTPACQSDRLPDGDRADPLKAAALARNKKNWRILLQ